LSSSTVLVIFEGSSTGPLWASADDVICYIRHLGCPVFALEEPLRANEYDDCRKIFETLSTPIILDESFTAEADFETLQTHPEP